MKQFSAIIFGLFLLLSSSCRTAQPTELPTLQPSQAALEPVFTTISLPTATLIPCDPTTTDFCLVDWKTTFQNPLGPDSPLTIARSYPYGSTENGQRDPHRGVDIESRDGAPVYAPAAGLVIFAGRDHERIYTPWDDYYGNLIVLQHDDEVFTLYGHLSQINVSEGDTVNSGDVIAAVGNTGVAIGSHLHFEIRTGGDGSNFFSTENPELWLPLQSGMGTLSITLDGNNEEKILRNLVIIRYAPGTTTSEKKYYVSTYPKDFEHNAEDFAINSLLPGRYRIAFTDATGLYERIVNVEAGKWTQVVIQLK
ncbi:MAG: M23 family metallopeptidase [Chloroflexi bacterium]|nr:M23 family metallopeptidase [Chloroflexota bacterium]